MFRKIVILLILSSVLFSTICFCGDDYLPNPNLNKIVEFNYQLETKELVNIDYKSLRF